MGKKVLIVDDDENLVKMFSLRIKGAGFDAEVAKSGEEALEKMQATRPDIILLDLQMPGMKGSELAQKIAADESLSSIPIIFMTGKVDPSKEGLPTGEKYDVVIKPCDFTELFEKINKLAP